MKNKILSTIFYSSLSIFSLAQGIAFAAEGVSSKDNSDDLLVAALSSSNGYIRNDQVRESCNVRAHRTYQRARQHHDTWIWGGVGLLFTGGNLQDFIDAPTMDYQVGFAQSIVNVRPRTFLYVGVIADFAYSKRFLIDTPALSYNALYSFANEQFVLGYEESLGTPYLSVFLEAGAAFQQRYFSIVENTTSSMIDYIFAHTFGGTFNGGFNVEFPQNKGVSYLFRLAMNVMVGGRATKVLDYNGENVNVNQLTYSPSISFGIRW